MKVREGLVQFPSGGLNMHAFVAQPDATAPLPGVLVIQEWWGLNEHIRGIAARIAAAGYVTLAPDVYSRLGHIVTTDAQEANRLMQSLKEGDAMKDLATSLDYLARLKDVNSRRLGVVGFCLGGSYALQLACASTEIRAAVAFYGQVPSPDQLRHLRSPVLYVYGGRDTWVPRKDVERLRDVLTASAPGGQVHIYEEAGHAFFNDTRPDVYQARAAKDAWQNMLAFLKTHLG